MKTDCNKSECRGPGERRRSYIALKKPHSWGLVVNPRIRIVYRDIRLRPDRAHQKQGDRRREDLPVKHRGERVAKWPASQSQRNSGWRSCPANSPREITAPRSASNGLPDCQGCICANVKGLLSSLYKQHATPLSRLQLSPTDRPDTSAS